MKYITITNAAELLGALSLISTVLAHLPFMPPKAAELFARFGVATQKFSVNQRRYEVFSFGAASH